MLPAIRAIGGVPVLGRFLPIWAVVLEEFCLAYSLEMLVGQPCSFKLALRLFDPQKTHPVLFETAVISATVAIMCPAMSFLAAILYYPWQFMPFAAPTLLANWLRLVFFTSPRCARFSEPSSRGAERERPAPRKADLRPPYKPSSPFDQDCFAVSFVVFPAGRGGYSSAGESTAWMRERSLSPPKPFREEKGSTSQGWAPVPRPTDMRAAPRLAPEILSALVATTVKGME